MKRAVAALVLALISCGPSAPGVWGIVLERTGDNITLLSDGGLVDFTVSNARLRVGDCVKVAPQREESGRARQVARESAGSRDHPDHCPLPEIDETFGYLSCNEEQCTFSSPEFPDVRAEPLFLPVAQQQFNAAVGLPTERRPSESWPYCVRLRGLLGPEGAYGHLGANNRVLYILKVDAARNVPHTSWCSREFIERAPSANGHHPTVPFYD